MSKALLRPLLAMPTLLAATFVLSNSAFAAETVESVSVDTLNPTDAIQLAQVTNVSDLSDVLPSDWAYTALQRLVEEYGCLEGYPDRTFRGNRAMTRYEFAAGLNACLDVVVLFIGNGSDLETVRRLQEEFAAELATLRGRVDTLEADVAELEANQFSTTTKLRGQLDAHLVIPFDAPAGADDTTFEYRARLNFDTSFTGKDRLRVRLQAGDRGDGRANAAAAPGTASLGNVPGRLANQSGTRSGLQDNVGLDDVYYSFPIGERISAIVAANSIASDDFVSSTIVPFDGPSVGDFGNPAFYDDITGDSNGQSLGLGVNFSLTENFILDVGYSTRSGQNASVGIFDDYEYIVQLNYLTDGLLDAAITYLDGDIAGADRVDYIVAGLLSLDFGSFKVGGYYAFTEDGPAAGTLQDSWQAGISFPNFLGTGNIFGAYAGESTLDTFTAEGYYNVKLNKFLTVTPAVIYADPTGGVDSEVYGVIRSTFRF